MLFLSFERIARYFCSDLGDNASSKRHFSQSYLFRDSFETRIEEWNLLWSHRKRFGMTYIYSSGLPHDTEYFSNTGIFRAGERCSGISFLSHFIQLVITRIVITRRLPSRATATWCEHVARDTIRLASVVDARKTGRDCPQLERSSFVETDESRLSLVDSGEGKNVSRWSGAT